MWSLKNLQVLSLFFTNCTIKITWLLIYTKNITTTTNFDSAREFLVHSTDWLKPGGRAWVKHTSTLVKFKLFQDQHSQNHSAKKCARIDLYGHQPVKDNSVYNNQQTKVFLNSSSIMRARRLQQAFTEIILPFWNQENASSSHR